MKRILVACLVVIVGVLLCGASCQNGGVGKGAATLREQLSPDYQNYHFYSSPAGNFGAGTMYLKDAANAQNAAAIDDSALIAIDDDYTTSNLSEAEKQKLLEQIFRPATIGKLSAKVVTLHGVALGVAVPDLYRVVNADAGVDLSNEINVDVSADDVKVRKTDWTQLKRAIAASRIASDVQSHLSARDVIIAMNDIVIGKYHAVVTVKHDNTGKLNLALTKQVGKTLGSNASGKFQVTSSGNGTYEIEALQPVIAAVLFKEIPQGALEAKEWPDAQVGDQNFDAMLRVFQQRRVREASMSH